MSEERKRIAKHFTKNILEQLSMKRGIQDDEFSIEGMMIGDNISLTRCGA